MRILLVVLVVLSLAAAVLWLAVDVDTPRGEPIAHDEQAPVPAADPVLQGKAPADGPSKGWRLRVRAEDQEHGHPLAHAEARVEVTPGGGFVNRFVREVRLDAKGCAVVPLDKAVFEPRGLWGGLHVDGFRSSWIKVKAVEGETQLLEARFLLEKRAEAAGILVPPPGVPPEAVRVWTRGQRGLRKVVLDPDGRFDLGKVNPGYEFGLVAAALYEGARYTGLGKFVAGRATLDLTWSEACHGDRALVEIQLVDEVGRPVTGSVQLGIEQERACGWRTIGELTGTTLVAIKYHPDRHFHVLAEATNPPGLGDIVRTSVSQAETTLCLVFEPAKVLEGKVVRRGEGALAGLPVILRWLWSSWRGEVYRGERAATVTNADGAFTLDGLGEAQYLLSVWDREKLRILDERVVVPGYEPIEITLEPVQDVVFEVLAPDGKPVQGARVELSLPPPGLWMSANRHPYAARALGFQTVAEGVTDESGSVSLEAIDLLRQHRLFVAPPEDREDVLRLERQPWDPAERTLRLARGWFIEGRVIDDRGAPVAFEHVHAEGLNIPGNGGYLRQVDRAHSRTKVSWPSDRTDEEGAFRIGPLPAGTWRLDIWDQKGEEIEVEAGARDVVLQLPVPDRERRLPVIVHVLDLKPEDRGRMAFYGQSGRRLDAKGRVRFLEIRPSKPRDLWIPRLSDGRYVWVESLPPSEKEHLVRPQQGGTIRGRVTVPAGVTLDSLSVWPDGPVMAVMRSDPAVALSPWTADKDALTFEVNAVPPGLRRISILGKQGDTLYRGRVEASAGDEVVVELKE